MTEQPPQDQLLQVHRRLDAHEHRLSAQDGRIHAIETQQAVSDERAAHIRKSLDEIRDGQKWLLRLVIGAIASAVVVFMIRGGFHVG